MMRGARGRFVPQTDIQEHEKQIAVSLYSSGVSLKRAAEITGFPASSIRNWVLVSGVQLRQKCAGNTGRVIKETVSPHGMENRRWYAKNPHKGAAHRLLNKAIADGLIERLPCAVCGASKSHGHHEDYSKPLEVMWLCPQHHRARHREIDRAGSSQTSAGRVANRQKADAPSGFLEGSP